MPKFDGTPTRKERKAAREASKKEVSGKAGAPAPRRVTGGEVAESSKDASDKAKYVRKHLDMVSEGAAMDLLDKALRGEGFNVKDLEAAVDEIDRLKYLKATVVGALKFVASIFNDGIFDPNLPNSADLRELADEIENGLVVIEDDGDDEDEEEDD